MPKSSTYVAVSPFFGGYMHILGESPGSRYGVHAANTSTHPLVVPGINHGLVHPKAYL
jgi:hypothetical protein